MKKIKTIVERLGLLLTAALLFVSLSGTAWAQSPQEKIYNDKQPLKSEQLDTVADETPWYDPTVGECAPLAGGDLEETTGSQDENARIIIGIAKTMNLGQEGALIGLMTALVESGLKNYANDGTWREPNGSQPYLRLGPISQGFPHDAVGNDHDSVGIMQQRAIDGRWGPVDPAENLEENVKWLMTPSYASQAFYRALIRLGDWRSLPPGVAAQRVQVSAYPDRYAQREGEARGYLNRLWSQSLPIPLPVPGDDDVAEPGSESGATACPVVSGSARDKILQTIALYAWPKYCASGSGSNCPWDEEVHCKSDSWSRTPLTAKKEYCEAIRAARVGCNPALREGNPGEVRCEYIGDQCGKNIFKSAEVGADCGGFVTRVMRDSGVDPDYNTNPESNTTGGQWPYLKRSPNKYIEVPHTEIEPGDIAINNGHTYFYVGDAMKQLVPGWEGDSASASQCGRTAMAGPNDTASNYSWYRFVGNAVEADARETLGSPTQHHASKQEDPFPPLTHWSLTGRSNVTL